MVRGSPAGFGGTGGGLLRVLTGSTPPDTPFAALFVLLCCDGSLEVLSSCCVCGLF